MKRTVGGGVAAWCFALGTVASLAQTADAPPAGPGLDLIKRRCVACHGIEQIVTKRKTPDDWADTVDTMIGRGARVTPDEAQVITDYLATNFPATPAAP